MTFMAVKSYILKLLVLRKSATFLFVALFSLSLTENVAAAALHMPPGFSFAALHMPPGFGGK